MAGAWVILPGQVVVRVGGPADALAIAPAITWAPHDPYIRSPSQGSLEPRPNRDICGVRERAGGSGRGIHMVIMTKICRENVTCKVIRRS